MNECLMTLQHEKQIGYWVSEKGVLFIDALNTLYLKLYGVGYMLKDHSD